MLTLEKYSGSGSRHTCPACGRAKQFTLYIDAETGRYLANDVGRCNRESSCGYHYTPKEYFADNPGAISVSKMSVFKRVSKQDSNHKTRLERGYEGRFQTKKPDCIDIDHLLQTLTDYDQNSFVQFLLKLFPYDDPSDLIQTVKEYCIGTKDGFTVFPTISKIGKICKAKLIKFDPATGKRIKDGYSISSLESILKREGKLKKDFETDKDVFFGEHLSRKYAALPIAIVESEKSAVIGSICQGVFPDMVWLAAGSKQWLKANRLERLGRDRKIFLYPDADGFDKWQGIASDASKVGLTVKVSNLIEKRATSEAKAKQVDLADYLINEQQKRNDAANREAFRDLIEERLAIMTIDGGMSDEQAEAEIIASGFYAEAIRAVLE